jgi:signal transduction histidine kinase/CheY-like chemotaxis protein
MEIPANAVSLPEGQPGATHLSASSQDATQGLIALDSFKFSARLAGVAGGSLLLLAALLAWLDADGFGLPGDWRIWLGVPAGLAAFGGPLVARRLLSRRFLGGWRVLLSLVMAVNGALWALGATMTAIQPEPSLPIGALAVLGMAIALLPSLSWWPGLLLQLLVQAGAAAAWLLYDTGGLMPAFWLLGAWLILAAMAAMAAFFARRVDRARADAHFMRIEASELQRGLDQLNERLQSSYQERDRLEVELAEILNLAEGADRAKTEFLATMSHEIRTPLNGILPILEMLRDTRLDKEQQKLIATAQSSSRHLLRIINDILDFAKVESGKLQLEAIEIDVRDMVAGITELMSGSASNHSLRLNANIAPNVPQVVRGDPIRLRQILINLVSNAIKFTEQGGIRIEVSRGETSAKEVELLFAVADTGVGMSQDTAERLFQSFTQADASTTRKHGGTGLGLVICKRLVELMGGKIGVRSTLGQGSTFWFLVPLRKSVMEVPSARTNLNGVRLLALTQDDERAAALTAMLRDWGLLVERVRDSLDVVARLRSTMMLGNSWGYELLLIDGTGIESRLVAVVSEVRGLEALRQLRIVAAVRSESVAETLERDLNVNIIGDALRPEPLRRVLHRLFDVESRHFISPDMHEFDVYDDLNVSVEGVPLDEDADESVATALGRALLVEDNPVNLGVIRKAVSKLGLTCDTAADGQEAVDRFAGGSYDLVLMDCQMPVMDGYEATRQMRRLEEAEKRAPTPVIAMTANAMAGDREKCLEAGMDDYLAKPFSLEQLRACVSNWLLRSRGGQPAPVRQLPGTDAERVPSAVLDEKVLADLRGIMENDYLALIQTYLDSAPKLVADVQAAIARRDVGSMVIPVHSLKSSSANVGALQLSALARETEQLARAGKFGEAEAAFRDVETAYDDAVKALRRHVADAVT